MISTQVLLEPLPVLANLPATRLYVAAKTFTTSNLWDVLFSAEINQCVGPAGGIIYYSDRLDAARECLASSHEAS